MNVNDIPIEIVDHFSDTEQDIFITDVTNKLSVYLKPLNDDDWENHCHEIQLGYL